MHNLHCPRPLRIHLLLLLHLFFFLTLTQANFVPTNDTLKRVCDKARSNSERPINTTVTPLPYICHLNVSYVRKSGCAVTVTENLILPYSLSNGLPSRPISRLSEQEIKGPKIRVIAGGSDFTKELNMISETDQAILYRLPMPVSKTPIALQLQYTLTNGVNEYDDNCGLLVPPGHELADGSDTITGEMNVVRFRLEKWPIDVADSEFTYSTSSSAARIMHATLKEPLQKEKGLLRIRMGIIKAGELSETIYWEQGVKLCPTGFQCFDEPLPVTKIVFIVVAVVILVIFLMCIVFCRVRKKKGGGYVRRRQRNAQLPDEFNAEENEDTDPPSTR